MKALPKTEEKERVPLPTQMEEMRSLIAKGNFGEAHKRAEETEHFDVFKTAVNGFLDKKQWGFAGSLIIFCGSRGQPEKARYAAEQFREKATPEELKALGNSDMLYMFVMHGSPEVQEEAKRLADLKGRSLPSE